MTWAETPCTRLPKTDPFRRSETIKELIRYGQVRVLLPMQWLIRIELDSRLNHITARKGP